MSYITLEKIQSYKKMVSKEQLSESDMLNMVNWFAEGVITSLSNKIKTLIEMKNCERISNGLSSTCCCGSCYTWKFLEEDGKIIQEVEDLKELIK